MNIGSNVNIHVVFFDTQILKTCIIRNKHEAEEFIRGYNAFGFGGTDFNCVFDYADEFRKKSGGRPLKGLFFPMPAEAFPTKRKTIPLPFSYPKQHMRLILRVLYPGGLSWCITRIEVKI